MFDLFVSANTAPADANFRNSTFKILSLEPSVTFARSFSYLKAGAFRVRYMRG